ncbi:MAG: NADPH-dependent FMN reductase [Microbacteriaceae bacterium]
MTTVMIIVGSVRPGRVGLPVSEWVRRATESVDGVTVDFVDLAELGLPFMDEPNHPAKKQYTKQHTIDWSARVDAADAYIFVTPEYNHSYSPVLKNAIDFLFAEWGNKPVSVVSYGGVSSGTRAAVALEPVLTTVRLVRTGASVEMTGVGARITDGVFEPSEKESSTLSAAIVELLALAGALSSLR